MESGASMRDVAMWKAWDSSMFGDVERPLEQLKSLLIRTLFDWSWAWGFTMFEFQNSFTSSI